jgi:hypothetical protein
MSTAFWQLDDVSLQLWQHGKIRYILVMQRSGVIVLEFVLVDRCQEIAINDDRSPKHNFFVSSSDSAAFDTQRPC